MEMWLDYSSRGEPRLFRQYMPPDIPFTAVEIGAKDRSPGRLPRELFDEGWRGLLIEADKAKFRQLAATFEAYPNVTCVNAEVLDAVVDKSSIRTRISKWMMIVLSGEALRHQCSFDEILSRHRMAQIGLLILNDPLTPIQTVLTLDNDRLMPWLLLSRDNLKARNVNGHRYQALVQAGYRFAGIADEYSIWILATVMAGRSEPFPVSPPSRSKQASGRVLFDEPTCNHGNSGLSGASSILISGWACNAACSISPPEIYLKLENKLRNATEYFRAYRYSRPDVAAFFQNSNLENAGFRCIVPFHMLRRGTYTITVVQCDDTAIYLSDVELCYPDALEIFEQTAREGLSHKFLYGSGIEVGALQRQLLLPRTASVRYIDRLPLEDLVRHYPELKDLPIQEPDIIDDAEQLHSIAIGCLDFIIANHFIEHCQDPFGTIEVFLSKLKVNGILYMAVPDKRYTFDSERPVTSYNILKDAYASKVRHDSKSLFYEWAKCAEGFKGIEIESRASQLLEDNYSIHFNVWTVDELLEQLLRARRELNLPFAVVSIACVDNENILILSKTSR